MGTFMERWLQKAAEPVAVPAPVEVPAPKVKIVEESVMMEAPVTPPQRERPSRIKRARVEMVEVSIPDSPRKSKAVPRTKKPVVEKPIVEKEESEDEDEGEDRDQDDETSFKTYEEERAANIARNNAMLRELGLFGSASSPAASFSSPRTPAAPARRPARDFSKPTAMPTRRSARLEGVTYIDESRPSPPPARSPSPPLDFAFRRSSSSAELSVAAGHKHAVYSLTLLPLANDRGVVAAAGGLGLVSLFSVDCASPSSPSVFLGSARLHSRWIGDARFLSDNDGTGALLASCSDDGTAQISRLSLEDALSDDPSSDVSFRLVSSARASPHRSGVFSLDACSASRTVVTAGKDGCVALMQATPSSLSVTRTIQASTDVSKSVRLQGDLLVVGGNDRTVRIFDTRSSSDDPVCDYSTHVAAVNAVDIDAPGDRVLSAGFDGIVAIYDLKAKSIITQTSADGPRGSSGGRSSQITHPVFAPFDSSIIAIPHPGRPAITVVDAATGEYKYDAHVDPPAVVSALCHVPGSRTFFAAAGKNWFGSALISDK